MLKDTGSFVIDIGGALREAADDVPSFSPHLHRPGDCCAAGNELLLECWCRVGARLGGFQVVNKTLNNVVNFSSHVIVGEYFKTSIKHHKYRLKRTSAIPLKWRVLTSYRCQ